MLVRLDSKTLEVLADFICGDPDSPGVMYRKGRQLPRFFRDCGLSCVDFGKDSRIPWTCERLKEYNASCQMDKILLRLVDPLEYQSEERPMECVKTALQFLNKKLLQENLSFIPKGNGFVLSTLSKEEQVEARRVITFVKEVAPDFSRPGFHVGLDAILTSRWEDAQRCWECGAFAMSIICMGSLLEGVLLCVVSAHPDIANQAKSTPKTREGKAKKFTDWNLQELLAVASDCGWVLRDRYDFSQVLRDYRNIVHPWHQAYTKTPPDGKTCAICWEVVKAAVKDLLRHG